MASSSSPGFLTEDETLMPHHDDTGLLYPDPWSNATLRLGGEAKSQRLESVGIVLNLLNTMSGPAILIAPFAFYSAGIVGGCLLLLIAAGFQVLSLYMLVVSSHLSGRASYRGLMSSLFGRSLPRLADLLIFLYALAVMVLHSMVLRDVFPRLLSHWSHHIVSPYWSFLFALLVLIPIALVARRMTYWVIPSLLAFLCTVLVACSLIYAYAYKDLVEDPIRASVAPVLLFRWEMSALEALAIFMFVLTPQLLFFPIVRPQSIGAQSIVGQGTKTATRLLVAALALGFCMYCFVGISGYLAAQASGLNPLPNILLQMDLSSTFQQAAMVAMLCNLALNFALFCFAGRESLDSLLFGRPQVMTSTTLTNESIQHSDLDDARDLFVFEKKDSTRSQCRLLVRLVLESVFILGLALCLGIFISEADVRSIAGVTGATLCVAVCFLLPAMYYMRAWKGPTCWVSFAHSMSVYGLGAVMIIMGLLVGAGCLAAVLRGVFLV